MANDHDWISVSDTLPPRNTVVMTRIDDGHGEPRMEQKLKLIDGNDLWWLENVEVYVYYRPTHWRHCNG